MVIAGELIKLSYFTTAFFKAVSLCPRRQQDALFACPIILGTLSLRKTNLKWHIVGERMELHNEVNYHNEKLIVTNKSLRVLCR